MKLKLPLTEFFSALYKAPSIQDVIEHEKTMSRILILNCDTTINNHKFQKHMAVHTLQALELWEQIESNPSNHQKGTQ